jgi:tRNA-specific 2-thiouridylase
VLYPLAGQVLHQVVLPVGAMTKADVRRRAAALGLRTAAKAESQDVCFVTRAEGRGGFLSSRVELHPGTVLDELGATLGSVDAVELVTVGQRRGLGLGGGPHRRFVTRVDVSRRTVQVGPPEDLLVAGTTLDDVVWTHDAVVGRVQAQCSAHGAPSPASVRVGVGGEVELDWDEPHRRVAPGQSVVLYREDVVVGGGVAVGPGSDGVGAA